MSSRRFVPVAGCLAVVASVLACRGAAPRMRVVTQHPRAGDAVVVSFDVSPVPRFARGDVWLTLAPAGSADDYVGERVVIEEGAAEAAIAAHDEGSYELRLVDASPRRWSRVVDRRRLEVERAGEAPAEPPAWYW